MPRPRSSSAEAWLAGPAPPRSSWTLPSAEVRICTGGLNWRVELADERHVPALVVHVQHQPAGALADNVAGSLSKIVNVPSACVVMWCGQANLAFGPMVKSLYLPPSASFGGRAAGGPGAGQQA